MKIYVGNLPFTVDSEKLKGLFASFGDIEEATVISDRFSGRSHTKASYQCRSN